MATGVQMAKKHKDEHKKGKKNAARGERAEAASGRGADAGREQDMRRIAREAAWSRMFGASGRNPFTQQT